MVRTASLPTRQNGSSKYDGRPQSDKFFWPKTGSVVTFLFSLFKSEYENRQKENEN